MNQSSLKSVANIGLGRAEDNQKAQRVLDKEVEAGVSSSGVER